MVAKRPPHYKLSTFLRACSLKRAANVRKLAMADAKKHFDLYPESELLKFIAKGRLENMKHDNTSTLDYDPPNNKDVGKPVDAYTFNIGPKHGYIAFYLNFSGKWIVKSFHPPVHGPNSKDNKELTHNPFQILGEM
jgi:hypothetical protein